MKKIFSSILLLITLSSFSQTQWVQMTDSLLRGGMFCSDLSVYHNDSVTLIGTSNGTYSSIDLGANWQYNVTGLGPRKRASVYSVVSFNNLPYILQSYNKVYSSNDNGNTFYEIATTGIPSNYNATSMYRLDSILFISGFYNDGSEGTYYTSNGINWNQVTTLTFSEHISDKLAWTVIAGSYYLMRSDRTVYTSSAIDSLNMRLTIRGDKDGNNIFMTTSNKTLLKMDMSLATPYWTQITLPDTTPSSISIYTATNALLLSFSKSSSTGNFSTELYRSTDLGNTWTKLVSSGIAMNRISYFNEMATDTLIANDVGGNIVLSTDAGLTWNQKNFGFYDHYQSNLLTMNNSLLLRIIKNNGVADGIIKSTDNGATWDVSSSGLPFVQGNSLDSTVIRRNYDYLFKQGNVAFSGNQQTLYRSYDEGNSWDSISIPTGVGYFIGAYGGDENSFFIGMMQDTGAVPVTIIRYYRSNDYGDTWQHIPSIAALNMNTDPVAPFTIIGKNDTMLLVHRHFVASAPTFYVYKSVDNGDTWTDISGSLFLDQYKSIDFANIIGTGQIPLFAFGTNTSKFMAVINTHTTLVPPDYLYLLSDTLYMYNQATGWSQLAGTGLPAGIDIQSIALQDTIWNLGSNMGVFSSNDDGATWIAGSSIRSLKSTNTIDGLFLEMNIQTLNFRANDGFIGTAGTGCWTTVAPVLGTNDAKELEADLKIFPNPSSGIVNFVSKVDLKKYSISAYDLTGRLVQNTYAENILAGEKKAIDFSQMDSGIYLLKINTENYGYHQKIIISR